MGNNMLKILAMRAKNRLINKGNSYYDARIKVISNDDAEFVEKVRKLLEEKEACCNPLKILMDEKKVSKMDECGRERYLLQTMDKYLKAKEQIEHEHNGRAYII